MKNEVRYVDGGGQPVHELFSRATPRQPDEEVMAMEENAPDDGMCCLGEVVDYLLADSQPMDWRYVLRRLVWLVGHFSPAAGAAMAGLCPEVSSVRMGGVAWGLGEVRSLADAPERVRALVLWLCGGCVERMGRREVQYGVMRVYFLSLGVRPEKLVREGHTMTLEDFAVAFGEEREGARQRWSARGTKLLAGLPQMEWQRSASAKEKARVNATRLWENRKAREVESDQ